MNKLNSKFIDCPYCKKEFSSGTGHPELLDNGSIELCKETCFRMFLNILAVPLLTAFRASEENKDVEVWGLGYLNRRSAFRALGFSEKFTYCILNGLKTKFLF